MTQTRINNVLSLCFLENGLRITAEPRGDAHGWEGFRNSGAFCASGNYQNRRTHFNYWFVFLGVPSAAPALKRNQTKGIPLNPKAFIPQSSSWGLNLPLFGARSTGNENSLERWMCPTCCCRRHFTATPRNIPEFFHPWKQFCYHRTTSLVILAQFTSGSL